MQIFNRFFGKTEADKKNRLGFLFADSDKKPNNFLFFRKKALTT